MWSAVSFLCTSQSVGGGFDIAVSASSVRFCIQLSFIECRLYLGPCCSSVISWLVKVMFVLFMTLGWKYCFCQGGFVCDCVSCLSFYPVSGIWSVFISGVCLQWCGVCVAIDCSNHLLGSGVGL